MERIKRFISENNWTQMGIIAYYGYFAINVLIKAFAYDSSDQIYKFFMMAGVAFLALKLLTTKYTLREIVICGIFLGLGIAIWIITKKATLLLLFITIVGMKGCKFKKLIGISVYIRVFVAVIMILGSVYGIYDIGYKTTPNASYVEVPVYSFGFLEPNTAFLTIFLLLVFLIYYNYEKLNVWWFLGTTAVAVLIYEFTFCRTGIIVFAFTWLLVLYEKKVPVEKAKYILSLSVPVGTAFSFITMILYNSESSIMRTMDRYVSGRLNIMGGYFQDQGLALYPRNQEFFYASYHGLIDNSYMYVLLYCGWIFALLFFAVVAYTSQKLYFEKHYKELVMISAFALYGVLEQFVLNGFMNPFILLIGILLYPGLLDEKEQKREKLSHSSNS